MRRRGRWTFVRVATAAGWEQLVAIAGHIGALLILLALVGIPFGFALAQERWQYALFIALVVVLLFGEGAYRLWIGEHAARVDAEMRAGALDSMAQKVAWLQQERGYGEALRDEIAPLTHAEWYQQRENLRYRDLLLHWEAAVGDRLRREFSPVDEKTFSRDDDGGVDMVSDSMIPLEFAAYLQRRRHRLDEIASRHSG